MGSHTTLMLFELLRTLAVQWIRRRHERTKRYDR